MVNSSVQGMEVSTNRYFGIPFILVGALFVGVSLLQLREDGNTAWLVFFCFLGLAAIAVGADVFWKPKALHQSSSLIPNSAI